MAGRVQGVERTKLRFAEDMGFKRLKGEETCLPSGKKARLEMLGVTVVFQEWRESWQVWGQEGGCFRDFMKENLRR